MVPLLEYLATQSELRHLLLIGAYRDNEVTPTHPLMQRIAAINQAGTPVEEIVLAPLGPEDLNRLIMDEAAVSSRAEGLLIEPLGVELAALHAGEFGA
jgi:predicted ATPase